jgi:hypothetical protein
VQRFGKLDRMKNLLRALKLSVFAPLRQGSGHAWRENFL